MTLKQLEKKIEAVEKRLAKLEKGGRRSGLPKKPRARKNGSVGVKNGAKTILKPKPAAKTENERALDILARAGLLAELPPQAKADAAKWRALPLDERTKILDEFANLPLPKTLSEIIIENRR